MEDLEWRNAMQFMLLVYLDEKRWAKIPEETSGCRPKRRGYALQSSQSHPRVARSASPEHS